MKPYFVDLLAEKFEDRCRRNPRYSLRAFARDLGLSAPRLSQIMNGKLGLSAVSTTAVSLRLGLTTEESEHFRDSVASRHSRSPLTRAKASLRLEKYKHDERIRRLSLDHFAVIADWYHLAIVELATFPDFQSDAVWIAGALDIKPSEAAAAIERLQRIGLLKREKGRLVPTKNMTKTPTDIPSRAIKLFHEQILQKAISALDGQSVEKRDFGALTFSLRIEDLPEIKKEIRRFRHDLMQKYEETKRKDAIYCLATQLFSLTEFNKESR